MPLPPVICFGEILWDFLPDGIFPGGAPFNVGYHLHRLGVPTHIVSAVGQDVLGDELKRRLEAWGLPVEAITRPRALPTGFVRATLGANGDAHYEIMPGVAWDAIDVSEPTLAHAAAAGAIIYGSLAQRSRHNRTALARLLVALPPSAWRVFDVNLRAPYDDLALVRELAAQATLLKLNHEEAARLVGERAQAARREAHARTLAAETGANTIVITAGAAGAGLLRAGEWHWEKSRSIQVMDTVGAGDAFLAALVAHLLQGASAPASLAHACRLGEWVASQRGATPAHPAAPPPPN